MSVINSYSKNPIVRILKPYSQMTESKNPPSSSLSSERNFQPKVNVIFGSTRVRSFANAHAPESLIAAQKSKHGIIDIHLIEPDYIIDSQSLQLADTPNFYNSCSESDVRRIRDVQIKADPMIKKLIDDVSAPYLAEIAFIQKNMEAKLKEAYQFSDKLDKNLQWTNDRLKIIANGTTTTARKENTVKEEIIQDEMKESYFDSLELGTPESEAPIKLQEPGNQNSTTKKPAATVHGNVRIMRKEVPEVLKIIKMEYCRYKWPTKNRTPFNEGFLRHVWECGTNFHKYYAKISDDNEIQFKSFLKHWRNRTLRYKAMEALGPLYLATKPPAGSKKKSSVIPI